MEQSIRFDTEAMRTGGRAIGDTAGTMQAELDKLVADQPAWGEDGISALCQMVYQAIVDVVTESGEGVRGAWGDHADRLEQAATLYEDTEAAAVEMAAWKA